MLVLLDAKIFNDYAEKLQVYSPLWPYETTWCTKTLKF